MYHFFLFNAYCMILQIQITATIRALSLLWQISRQKSVRKPARVKLKALHLHDSKCSALLMLIPISIILDLLICTMILPVNFHDK